MIVLDSLPASTFDRSHGGAFSAKDRITTVNAMSQLDHTPAMRRGDTIAQLDIPGIGRRRRCRRVHGATRSTCNRIAGGLSDLRRAGLAPMRSVPPRDSPPLHDLDPSRSPVDHGALAVRHAPGLPHVGSLTIMGARNASPSSPGGRVQIWADPSGAIGSRGSRRP